MVFFKILKYILSYLKICIVSGIKKFIFFVKYGSYITNKQLLIGNEPNISSHALFDIFPESNIYIGDNCFIDHYATFKSHCGRITIGHNFALGPFAVIYGIGNVNIGNNVIIGSHTVIIPSNHKFDIIEEPIRYQDVTREDITIQEDVWIGAGCEILGSVTIGRGCIIGAGSVVTKSIPEYSIAVGVPAKVIKSRK